MSADLLPWGTDAPLTLPAPGAPSSAAANGAVLAARELAWATDPVAAWLATDALELVDMAQLFAGICDRLLEHGLPLSRAGMGLRSFHPEVFARGYTWRRGLPIEEVTRDYAVPGSPMYLDSPVRLLHEGAGALRLRLDDPHAAAAFPITRELAAEGHTDYVIMPLPTRGSLPNFVSWTTDRPGGFDAADLRRLDDLMPLIALRIALEAAYDARDTLLATYLGRGPARRVLAGSVRRGQVESIRAVVLLSDLRGFTSFSDRHPPEEVIALLDEYFELLARPIERRGGEILKFIGDGLLAIFPVDGDARAACATALAAVLEGQEALMRANRRRRAEGEPEIACGLSLHVGDVQYGNIGAHDRLDFTVIGAAVNEASRVEQLCKALGRPVLITSAFAALAPPHRLVSLGVHALRGVREPQEIFTLTDVEPIG